MGAGTLDHSPPFGYFLVKKGMEEEIESYQKIAKISLEQQSALRQGNIDLLNSLIAEKHRLITQIDKIEKKISPARNSLRDNVDILPKDVLINLRRLHGELKFTMDDVRDNDALAFNFVKKVKNTIEDKIVSFRKDSRIVSQSYIYQRKDEKPVPRFFDKMG